MTARLAGVLSGAAPEQNIALVMGPGGQRDGRPPEQVAEALNRLLLDDIQTEQYLTLLYADVDLQTGDTALVQAGHPHPAVQRANGTVEFIGTGGLPVGLIPGARYDRVTLSLAPGDRLLLMSDGMTECMDAQGAQLGEAGIAELAIANAGVGGMAFLNSIVRGLHGFAGTPDFADDVSAVLLERGPLAG